MKKNLFSNKLSAEFQETKENLFIRRRINGCGWRRSSLFGFVIIVAIGSVSGKKPVTPAIRLPIQLNQRLVR